MIDLDAGGTLDSIDASKPPPVAQDAGAKQDASTPPVATFSVGGTVTGLSGTGLVLQNNLGDDLAVGANGSFVFSKKLLAGAAFSVSVKTQPSAPAQTCSVSGESGTIANGNVTSVVVNCASDKFTVGGTITGLVGTGLTLQNNAGDDLLVNANGTFAFSKPVTSGTAYAVTVKTQPGSPSQTCTVTDGTGTMGSNKVTNVAIACTTNKYTVGGTVSGLNGQGLVLQVNGNAGETLPVAASGAFTFPTSIASGAAYAVTVSAQPTDPSQTCVVTGGTGTVGAGNVTSVAVNCTTNKYTVGGTVSGLLGSAVLQNNGGNDLVVNANGTFAFATPIDSGADYAVTIKTQPGVPSQTCTLADASGKVAAANVTSVTLTCVTNTFLVKGTVTGLAGGGLALQNKGADTTPIAADGAFEFAAPIASGQTYAVTVSAQPTALSQTCVVANGSGTIGAADVTNVTVTCTTNTYTVGGSVAGLTGVGLVLTNNGGDDRAVVAPGGAFTFATRVASGGAYAVAVKTQPTNPSQTCVVSAGAGTVTNGNVVTVNVNCTTNTYAVGGNASGLAGTGLVLRNNGGNNLTVNQNGAFAFSTPIASGQPYAVTVLTQPTNPSQTCTVTNAAGNVAGAPITNVAVTCVTNQYTIGGTITGLAGGTVVLRNNGGNDLARNADGAFTFSAPINSGAGYSVTVATHPVPRYCVVANGTGTVGAANVANVTVTCQPYQAVGTVNGVTFFGVNVAGPMTDNNAAAACQAVGLIVPCQAQAGCTYNGGGGSCKVTPAEDSCGNPMWRLAQAICGGTYPSQCPALYGTYQYMGNAWVSQSTCGAEANQWCVQGSNQSNKRTLCVLP